ncbi:sensor histidine kinase [Winogradskyella immobilis]|uniref:Sensor histidine kinase n=1 Tax=Winogradskyella immobilis TaxID=2816852 RepID=A0ABS8EK54_9FLAO|nr:sensor histidine kinase [Winogradskyella immobilis]MCC1483538.1 sensor histidine kinase [Winogradskyella immobilis]MCG0015632.1 sensor histidine kinase [Winogradskyella immobilis]
MKTFIKSYWSLVVMMTLLIIVLIINIQADFRINLFLFIFLFFGFVFLFQWLYLKKKTSQLQAMQIQSELDLLKSQIDPHFYFNTLNNLYGLAKRKSDQTPEAILKLSQVMRYVIYKGKESKVSLEEEIDYLENYIELQQLRTNKDIKIDFKKNIFINHVEIAPLLLIIPLENAFKHGVDTVLNDAYIDIILIADESKIQLEITNNFEIDSANEFTGIGLENLKKRLQLIYKDQHELKVTKNNGIYKFDLLIHQ